MLPASLARARRRQGVLRPARARLDDDDLIGVAEALVGLHAEAAQGRWTRGALDAAVQGLAADADRKIVLGLAHCLADFVQEAPPIEGFDAPAFRQTVFAAAAARGPVALEAGPFERTVAADLLGPLGAEHGLGPEEAARALYADLPSEHVVTAFEAPSIEALVAAYDVGLAQAPLLRADSLTLRLARPSVGRVRQLLRSARFHQLIHTAARDDDGLRVDFDGPLSLFGQTSRYGAALAKFLPTVFLQDGAWTVDADVRWPPGRAVLHLESGDGYVSHLPDHGAWKTRFHTWFEERWAARDTGSWRISDQTTPIDHGGLGVLLPDYEITDGARTALLEIVGYWTREKLARRLDQVARVGPSNLILAVSRKLCASSEGMDQWPAAVVPFAEVVPVPAVLEAVERVAR